MDSLVVPILASSSAFSLPHSPICAAIHRISRVLVDPSALIQSEEIAYIEERLSDHYIMMMCVCVGTC